MKSHCHLAMLLKCGSSFQQRPCVHLPLWSCDTEELGEAAAGFDAASDGSFRLPTSTATRPPPAPTAAAAAGLPAGRDAAAPVLRCCKRAAGSCAGLAAAAAAPLETGESAPGLTPGSVRSVATGVAPAGPAAAETLLPAGDPSGATCGVGSGRPRDLRHSPSAAAVRTAASSSSGPHLCSTAERI